MGAGGALFIMDRSGRLVWTLDLPEEKVSLQVRPGRADGPIIYNLLSPDHSVDEGTVEVVGFDGVSISSRRTLWGHHAFDEHDDGTIGWPMVDLRYSEVHETDIVGDSIMEMDPDGTERTLWSSWDWIEPEQNSYWSGGFYPQGIDWTHANAIDYVEANDSYLLSMAHLDTVVEVSREGNLIASYGVEEGSYSFDAITSSFRFQHGVHMTDEGTLLMTSKAPPKGTAAREYSIDRDEEMLTLIWEYSTQELQATTLGEAHRLSNGNTLVNFGSAAVLREVTPDGEIVWEATAAEGQNFGSVFVVADLYELMAKTASQ